MTDEHTAAVRPGAGHVSPRARVLLLAFACHPERGSEPGVGWNRAVQTAARFDTWVICEARRSRSDIEAQLREHGSIAGLKFVFVPLTAWQVLLGRLPAIGYLVAYRLWHRRAFRVARRLHQERRFDLVHQVNLCSYREPGYLWKLGPPFVWGPIGGTQNYPWRFLWKAGVRGAVTESIRNLLNWVQLRSSRRVRCAMRRAALVMAANSSNLLDFSRVHGVSPVLMLETGVGSHMFSDTDENRRPGGPLRILWSGVFQHRKALHLLLEALAEMPQEVEFELRILGQGSLERAWRGLARRRGIADRCRWLGWLPHAQAIRQFGWADVFVFTSLRDTSGNVVLEAMAAGTPVICFDHQGVHDIVTPGCGVKIAVTSSGETIDRLRESIVDLYRDRKTLTRMGMAARLRAREFEWSRQAEPMARLYRAVLSVTSATPSIGESSRQAQPLVAAASELEIQVPRGVGG